LNLFPPKLPKQERQSTLSQDVSMQAVKGIWAARALPASIFFPALAVVGALGGELAALPGTDYRHGADPVVESSHHWSPGHAHGRWGP